MATPTPIPPSASASAFPSSSLSPPPQKSVFVTGANGYIGSAVCRAFVRAGWRVYGLIRRPEAAGALYAEEIIPVIGSITPDATFPDALARHAPTLDVIVSCTQQFPFAPHFAATLSLVRKLAATSVANSGGRRRPLVLVTSGCKDYGATGVHGSAGLAPHVETSPLAPLDIIRDRALESLRVFEHGDLFDAAVLRPTPVYGYDSSYYEVAFEAAAAAAASKEVLELPFDFGTIVHGCHVDDCAEAYVALAEHADRGAVAGQCFNVSGARYETLGMIAGALRAEYGLRDVVRAPAGGAEVDWSLYISLGHSQWVDSTKIRRLTGWTDKRLPFWENIHVHRMAYEEAARRDHEGVLRVRDTLKHVLAGTKK
ncbi:NAD(P)-binding protein [Daldinia caldariorum]|uniref:NAD(P)-binding protein n=1 Tax=Daldinia caldariorum TaxID=326644 RepID=UPI002008AFEE|nr:NAD(P)-binding protein [Daldinia caldariorum]KAI1465361.1 NAD(P)-binding protein [Daldinia caldariorum]